MQSVDCTNCVTVNIGPKLEVGQYEHDKDAVHIDNTPPVGVKKSEEKIYSFRYASKSLPNSSSVHHIDNTCKVLPPIAVKKSAEEKVYSFRYASKSLPNGTNATYTKVKPNCPMFEQKEIRETTPPLYLKNKEKVLSVDSKKSSEVSPFVDKNGFHTYTPRCNEDDEVLGIESNLNVQINKNDGELLKAQKDAGLKCLMCPKHLESQVDLKIHLKNHTSSSAFNCQYCNFGASYFADILSHSVCHFQCQLGIKQPKEDVIPLKTISSCSFACTFCDRMFDNCADLEKHEALHKCSF